MSLADFRARFGYLVENELPPIVLVPSGHRDGSGPGSGSYFEGETL